MRYLVLEAILHGDYQLPFFQRAVALIPPGALTVAQKCDIIAIDGDRFDGRSHITLASAYARRDFPEQRPAQGFSFSFDAGMQNLHATISIRDPNAPAATMSVGDTDFTFHAGLICLDTAAYIDLATGER